MSSDQAEPPRASVAKIGHIGPFITQRVADPVPLDVVLGAESLCDDWLTLLAGENRDAARLAEEMQVKAQYPRIWRKVSYVRGRPNQDFFSKTVAGLKDCRISGSFRVFTSVTVPGLREWLLQRKLRETTDAGEIVNLAVLHWGISPAEASSAGDYDPRDPALMNLRLGLTRGSRFPEQLLAIATSLREAVSRLAQDGHLFIEWGGLVHHPFLLFLTKLLLSGFKSVKLVADPSVPDFLGCYVLALGLKSGPGPAAHDHQPMPSDSALVAFLDRFHRALHADDALCWWLGLAESFALFKKLLPDLSKIFQTTCAKLVRLHEHMTLDLFAVKMRVLAKIRASRALEDLFLHVHAARRKSKKKSPSPSPSRTRTPATAAAAADHQPDSSMQRLPAVRSPVSDSPQLQPPQFPQQQPEASPQSKNPQTTVVAGRGRTKPQKSSGQQLQPREARQAKQPGVVKSLGVTQQQQAPVAIKKRRPDPPAPAPALTQAPAAPKRKSPEPQEDHAAKMERLKTQNAKKSAAAPVPAVHYAAAAATSSSDSETSEKKKPQRPAGKEAMPVPTLNLREYLGVRRGAAGRNDGLTASLFDPSPLQIYDRRSLLAYSIPIPYIRDGAGELEPPRRELSLADFERAYKPEIPIVKTRNRILLQFKI